MGKVLTLPEWLSASTVATAADVGTVTDNGNGTITVTDVKISQIRAALGVTTNSLKELSISASVNGWSNWSPLTIKYDSVNRAFVFEAPSSAFKAGDFAAYNHQAAGPVCSKTDTVVLITVLDGYVDISSTLQLGEIDWNRKYISGKLFNYVWVECENTVGGVTEIKRVGAKISSTTGSAFATVLDMFYSVPKKGSDSITVRTFLGDSAGPLVQIKNTAGALTWSHTLKDNNVYFTTPLFDELTASGSGFDSANDYFIERGPESIDLQGNFSIDMDIGERDAAGNFTGKDCTTNKIYIKYTDKNSIDRDELVYTDLPMYAGRPYSGFTGKLLYPPKGGTDIQVIVRDAVLS